MISIEQLPVEVLMEIFGYLPNYGQVSLVNKLFYNVACSVNDVCVKLTLDSGTLVDPNHQSIMDSIQNTRRKVSMVCISFIVDRSSELWELAWFDILKILRKSSATIKHLRVEETGIEVAEFRELFSCIPDVEHLSFHSVYGTTQNGRWDQLNNECLKLDRLRTLELLECDEALLLVFGKLSPGVLNEFTITNSVIAFDLLETFFKQQSNIKKLTLSDEFGYDTEMFPDHIFDHLNLESLECHQNGYNSGHAKILFKQKQLKSLRLRGSDGEIDQSVLNAITNRLSKLETLEINVSGTLAVPFERIAKLKKLKDLTISSCSLKIIETFAGLDNSNITTLNMKNVIIWTGTCGNRSTERSWCPFAP